MGVPNFARARKAHGSAFPRQLCRIWLESTRSGRRPAQALHEWASILPSQQAVDRAGAGSAIRSLPICDAEEPFLDDGRDERSVTLIEMAHRESPRTGHRGTLLGVEEPFVGT